VLVRIYWAGGALPGALGMMSSSKLELCIWKASNDEITMAAI